LHKAPDLFGDPSNIIRHVQLTPESEPVSDSFIGRLPDWQKEHNTQVNKIRWMIEQAISHFKNWTIMHTDYRRPLGTFATTISAVVGRHFYRTA